MKEKKEVKFLRWVARLLYLALLGTELPSTAFGTYRYISDVTWDLYAPRLPKHVIGYR